MDETIERIKREGELIGKRRIRGGSVFLPWQGEKNFIVEKSGISCIMDVVIRP